MVRGTLLTLAALACGALLIAGAGLLPLSAASGHWPVTQWLVEFSQRRTVWRQSLAVTVPPLDEPGLALRGAGHYETACRRCHGVPGRHPPVVLREMLPPPPDLRNVSARYSSAELFQVVKHGLKFTGMPGWPAPQRDDEVWAMVAFLERLPAVPPDGYERLVFGEGLPSPPAEAPPAVVTAVCARCHGVNGLGRGAGAFPILAGQRPAYLHLALRAFAYGSRLSGIMSPIAASLSDETMREIADYYGRLPGLSETPEVRAATAEGMQIAMRGIPDRRVPSCADCHGPTEAPRKGEYPALAGQDPGYLDLQLRLFKTRSRGGSAFAHLMHQPADGLTEQEMDAVARYYGR